MIKIRAHHLPCIPRFYSGGYNKRFAENMKQICLEFRNNPNTKIRILVGKVDDICMKCPYRHREGCIQSTEISKWVLEQDRKVANYLGIRPNSIHKARDIFNLSMERINQETTESVCSDCIFLKNCIKVGINNSFRKDLNRKAPLCGRSD